MAARKGLIGAFALAAVAVACGCQVIGGFEDFEAASGGKSASTGGGGAVADSGAERGSTGGTGAKDGGSTGTGGAGSADACPSEPDPGKHGPAMGQMKRLDKSCFWIDATEVTVAQYAEFLAVTTHAAQDAACAWNDEAAAGGSSPANIALRPSADCVGDAQGDLSAALAGGAGGELPMTCVDWCDALAFCVWAGKDLCGDDTSSANKQSDWYQACTAGDPANRYSCEAPCDVTDCNGSSAAIGEVQPVGTVTGCAVASQAGAPDIRDLSGNVQEWTNYCSLGTKNAPCNTRGGQFDSGDSALQCGSPQTSARDRALATLGFRCCKDTSASGDI